MFKKGRRLVLTLSLQTLSQSKIMSWWATEGLGFGGETVTTADSTKYTADDTESITADGEIQKWDIPT